MAAPPTARLMRKRANAFIACRGKTELGRLLRIDSVRLAVMAEDPKYKTFSIPKKKKGTFRLVEDPEPKLKMVQRRLNDYLQAVYYFHRTDAAYGFLTNVAGDPEPRNIKTNAERHLGCDWLMNVDMRDFFHLIDRERVQQLFQAPLLNFPKNLARALAGLCCYKERLPMGAPTSPILSNLASIPLDGDLLYFANQRGWTYTRYADDMTFSSKTTPIRYQDIAAVNEWVTAYELELNPNKSVIYGPDHPAKVVTGLIVGKDHVSLSNAYLEALQKGIRKLDEVINAKYCVPIGRLSKTAWVEDIAQQLRGRLAFASQILDEEDPLRIDLEMAFENALEPPTDYEPVSWLDFGYTLFNQPRL
ncbi:MAG: RNA-directed DNA polymerase [Neolewinella sp.]|jgi:RNA-directed DNA polymerase